MGTLDEAFMGGVCNHILVWVFKSIFQNGITGSTSDTDRSKKIKLYNSPGSCYYFQMMSR